MTFSIVGHCPDTGAFGLAISSSSVCVAARCAWVRSDVGAVATQNLTNPLLGPLGLDLLARDDLDEAHVMNMLLASDPGRDYRQILVLGRHGHCVHHTGARALPIHASHIDEHCGAAGNLLANDGIPARMVAAFQESAGQDLAQRLLDAMHAGLAAGGETRALQSAGLVVADRHGWQTVDLRVDQHDQPLTELQRLWDLYAPLRDGYISRVTDPQRYVVQS